MAGSGRTVGGDRLPRRLQRQLEGAEYFDEAHIRALVARIVDRTSDMAASMTNHALAEEGELRAGGWTSRRADPGDSRHG